MPPGWKEAYTAWAAAGWNGLASPAEWGGQGLPRALNAACIEMWNSASMAFGIGPVLTMAGIDALAAHGTDDLKKTYLPKLDQRRMDGHHAAHRAAGRLRCRRAAQPGRARAPTAAIACTGQKIFITYGEHDLTDNIIHFVLARLPDAPPGTKGISLFLVPKFLLNADGTPGARNDVRAHSVEHKMGIHASPTCTMVYGDKGGAIGFLIGEENAGMACMFTMMNEARLAVGLQGVAIAERALQQALDYARDRKQGRGDGPNAPASVAIIEHADVRRMLLTMRALTRAARAICYATAVAIDRSHRAKDAAARKAAQERAALLTPIAKAFSTDIGIEVASLGVQVHGGMGFIEETGAAQHYRDARIAAIYEGTNGIQAIDLVTRKLPLSGGETVKAYIAELRDDRRARAGDQRSGLRRDRRTADRGDRQPRARDRLDAGAADVRHEIRAGRRNALSAAVRQCRRRLPAGERGAGRAPSWRQWRRRQRRPHRARALLCREHRGAEPAASKPPSPKAPTRSTPRHCPERPREHRSSPLPTKAPSASCGCSAPTRRMR